MVLLSGNLRTFRFGAAGLATFLANDPRFHGRPHYVFLHTWEGLESSEQTWWKKAGPPPRVLPSLTPAATLNDSSVNPWAGSPRFSAVVEPFDSASIPVPTNSPPSLFSQHVQWETRRRVYHHARAWLAAHGVELAPSTVVIKTRPDADYLNTPDLAEMEEVLRRRPSTFFGFCKGGAKFPHRIADSAWITSLRTHRALDSFPYTSAQHIVLKSKVEPEVNFASILAFAQIKTVLEVVGVRFCRVRWLPPAQQGGGAGVAKGSCLQHSKWDRDAAGHPDGRMPALAPWLAKAKDDTARELSNAPRLITRARSGRAVVSLAAEGAQG